jgi:putative toxin-antitoxin system antitoxin component (TIGR02293 family)
MEKRGTGLSAKRVSRIGAKARTPSARMRAPRPKQAALALKAATPEALYRATGLERVQLIREGVPAERIERLVRRIGIPKERLYATLHLPRSTVERKIRNKEMLCPEHSERLIGLERLIGQVEAMVGLSGDARGFDASRWVGQWLERPLPALGGAKPGDLMDTMQGQELVARLLAQALSGAYA